MLAALSNRPLAKIPAFTAFRFGIHLPEALGAYGLFPPSAMAHGKSVPRLAVDGGIFADGLLERTQDEEEKL